MRRCCGATSRARRSPNPAEAWRSVTLRWHEELGVEPRSDGLLQDPAGAILGGGGFIWLALKGMNREPIGCVALHKHKGDDGTSWELGELGVLVDSRREGVGKQLAEMLLRRYQEAAGESEPLWLSLPGALDAAAPFFERLGFQQDTATDHEAGPRMVYHGAHAPRPSAAEVPHC